MKKELIKELSKLKRNVSLLVEDTVAPGLINDINDYAGGMIGRIAADMTDKEALAVMELLEEMHVKELIYFLRMWLKGRQTLRMK